MTTEREEIQKQFERQRSYSYKDPAHFEQFSNGWQARGEHDKKPSPDSLRVSHSANIERIEADAKKIAEADATIELLMERNKDLSARLAKYENAEFYTLLLNMLRNNPWPTSDTRWQVIEVWAADMLKIIKPEGEK